MLAAVQAALNQALTASKPTLTVSPEKTSYDNGDKVTVTLDCPTDGAEIYYTVDNSNTLTGSTLSDPTKTGTKYTGPFEVSIDNIAGGKVYVRAAANKDGKWSGIVRKDLTFAKGVKENAFVVDGTNYQSWSDAVAAVNAANGGTIVLNDDVQLTEEDKLPDVACTIRSADGETKYKLSGSPLTLNGDLTLKNITYSVSRIYANGHDLTIANDVATAWSFTDYSLYAGSTVDSTAAGTQHISVQAGNFAVIASGRGSTTHKADVDVAVGGSAEVELAGAYMGAKLDGNVTFHVADGVKLNQFLGEQSGDSITGNLTLQINGTPTLKSYNPTYKASVNKDSFGTLDLTYADANFITANRDKFTGFATVKPTA
ncbi:FN3 associated domain-containing protein [Agathobaculum butyriciproducens]|uniref:FN3 associated domain-containing protein n=1 Tax=Agathobaculum butyriciproducens TaxID=1628085 RepID=UPI001D08FD92|nr:chitobiase/beta-hexosaminidase C-terminal domain-containing protein [Agathobaculum butyriciproducens]